MLLAVSSENNSAATLPISVVVIAKNEAKNLRDCLAGTAFAREIILVDDFSTDETAELAKSLGSKVFQRALDGDFSAQRKFALEQATQPWILFLDADERVPAELAEEIRKAVSSDEKFAYEIQRKNHFDGVAVNHGVLRSDFVLRLFPREGIEISGIVHEKISSPFPRRRLRSALTHFPYANWSAYFRKFEIYTQLAAEKYYDEGRQIRFFRDIVLRPAFAFFKMYFLKLGFLDGKAGWILSANHFFYTQMKYARAASLSRERGDDGFRVFADGAEWRARFPEILKNLRERQGKILAEKLDEKRPRVVFEMEFAGTRCVVKHEFFNLRFDRSLKAFFFGSDACAIFQTARLARERGFTKIPQIFLSAEKFSNGILRESVLVEEFLEGTPLAIPLSEKNKLACHALIREAHAAGVISGDICADNFVVGANGEMRLIDFRGNKIFSFLAKARDRVQLEQRLGVPAREHDFAEKFFSLHRVLRNLGRKLRRKETTPDD